MAQFCAMAAAPRAGPPRASGADGDELAGVLRQPALRSACVLLAGMEVGPEVFAPGTMGQPHQPAPAEQVARRAGPGAPAPERAVVLQVQQRLPQRVEQE